MYGSRTFALGAKSSSPDGSDEGCHRQGTPSVAVAAQFAYQEWPRGTASTTHAEYCISSYCFEIRRRVQFPPWTSRSGRPAVSRAIEAAGGARFNYLDYILGPEAASGAFVAGDDDFGMLTGRRAIVEAAMADVAAATPGVLIRRGVAVRNLLIGASVGAGIPHVVGVQTQSGEELTRRSRSRRDGTALTLCSTLVPSGTSTAPRGSRGPWLSLLQPSLPCLRRHLTSGRPLARLSPDRECHLVEHPLR